MTFWPHFCGVCDSTIPVHCSSSVIVDYPLSLSVSLATLKKVWSTKYSIYYPHDNDVGSIFSWLSSKSRLQLHVSAWVHALIVWFYTVCPRSVYTCRYSALAFACRLHIISSFYHLIARDIYNILYLMVKLIFHNGHTTIKLIQAEGLYDFTCDLLHLVRLSSITHWLPAYYSCMWKRKSAEDH